MYRLVRARCVNNVMLVALDAQVCKHVRLAIIIISLV